jgi:AraC-like DNA-binding protein
MPPSQADVRRILTRQLETFLHGPGVRKVHFAEPGAQPPALAYVTSFPRLTVVLSGRHPMEVARGGRVARIVPGRGHVVFSGRNCWNRPDWSMPARVVTFLFGKKQIGVSLVRRDRRRGEPAPALKTALGASESLTQNVLGALAAAARTRPLDRLLAEALLHACLLQLRDPAPHLTRKAARTYEALCLYAQENFQRPMTRESVARTFGLTPNHVSRLFRREGAMRFSDYLTRVRIDRAKFMLKEYASPLKEIAANCGYKDVAYFCRVFRRYTKVTPTEYRARGL